jgi:hypothetical protein
VSALPICVLGAGGALPRSALLLPVALALCMTGQVERAAAVAQPVEPPGMASAAWLADKEGAIVDLTGEGGEALGLQIRHGRPIAEGLRQGRGDLSARTRAWAAGEADATVLSELRAAGFTYLLVVERRGEGPELTFEHLLRKRRVEANMVTAVVRARAFWDHIGPLDEEVPGGYAEDYEWVLRAARRQPITVAPEPLVMVRWTSASHFRDRWLTIDRALAYLEQKVPEFRGDARGWARLEGQRAFAQAAAGRRGAAAADAWEARLAAAPAETRAASSVAASMAPADSGAMSMAERSGQPSPRWSRRSAGTVAPDGVAATTRRASSARLRGTRESSRGALCHFSGNASPSRTTSDARLRISSTTNSPGRSAWAGRMS